MKAAYLIIIHLFTGLIASAQHPAQILEKLTASQRQLRSASYQVQRSDTLLSGEIRKLSGEITVVVDTLAKGGVRFRAKDHAHRAVRYYDGKNGYDLDTPARSYHLMEKLPGDFFWNNGPGLIISDLVRLDTSGSTEITVSTWSKGYLLTIHYPDLPQYGITKRSKALKIDTTLWLPVEMTQHQLSNGQRQVLHYRASEIRINDPGHIAQLRPENFLKGYAQMEPKTSPGTSAAPQSKPDSKIPYPFELKGFDGKLHRLHADKGKVVLLDFWEVWCSPCIQSMPKLDSLYRRLRGKGLKVYGISHEPSGFVQVKNFASGRLSFPVLTGNQQSKKGYQVSSFPTYVLIGRSGKIEMTSHWISDELIAKLESLLAQ